MIHSVRFTCVLDTNVICPIDIRDLLFWFAYYDLYTPKWSSHIFDEWASVMKRKGVAPEEIEKRIANANQAFPDALVKNYEPLIDTLQLPDINDRHVLAAAIKTDVNIKLYSDNFLPGGSGRRGPVDTNLKNLSE
ncbi:MAG: PIN domain-containing protein [Tunicatimonas sp.]